MMNEAPDASMDQGGAVSSGVGAGEVDATAKSDQICRDYQRGVCSRGDKCKFSHPEGMGSEPKDKPMICRDFQNGTCNRSTCKYLHVSNQEEKVYLRTGQFPPSFGRVEQAGPRFDNGVPICKDFLNNKCNRGANCKFRHVQEDDVYSGGFYSEPPRKRPRDGFGSDYRQLMEENVSLRGRVSDLQKEVADLRATNDILLEQNARYRRSTTNGSTVGYGGGYATDARSGVTYPSRESYPPTISYNQSAYSVSNPTPTAPATTGYDGYTKFE